MFDYTLKNMPVDIRLWLINQRKQTELICAKIKKDRLEQLKASYFDFLMRKRQLDELQRFSNCKLPIKIEEE